MLLFIPCVEYFQYKREVKAWKWSNFGYCTSV